MGEWLDENLSTGAYDQLTEEEKFLVTFYPIQAYLVTWQISKDSIQLNKHDILIKTFLYEENEGVLKVASKIMI